jgi:apoptosis-inducing factor 2
MTRPRVVVAGLGDTGVLTAVRLARSCDVVGVSVRPALVSGQELGHRVTDPDRWARDYRWDFDRLRGLDRVRVVHGELTGADLAGRTVEVRLPDGGTERLGYDVLVVATGVSNGFWRQPVLESAAEVDAGLRAQHERLAAASSIAVVGGGAAAVGAAYNAARVWPDKQVDLYFPREQAIPQHHRRIWTHLLPRLERVGVGLHPGHRAELPADPAELDRIGSGPIRFTTGQPDAGADAVVWAVGRVRPNTGWLPSSVLDDDGFVRTDLDLTVPGVDSMFAIGDVAATDPFRSSARNRAYVLLAANIRARASGKPLKSFKPPRSRWGSVLGTQSDGLLVAAPNGRVFRIPMWFVRRIQQPYIVERGIYKGMRSSSMAGAGMRPGS